jgi:hypothetical protein
MTDNFNLKEEMFSSSSISEYMGCPRSFYWTYIRRLESKEPKVAMLFGTAFHEALKSWYTSHDLELAKKEFDSLPDVMSTDLRTKDWGKTIFEQYILQYKTDPGITLALEVKFRVAIGSRIYAGTMDRIINWDKSIYVVDHKTTAQLGLSYFDSYRPNPQIDGYCYVCRELKGTCDGAIINGISTAANPKQRFMRFPTSRTKNELDRWVDDFTLVTDDMSRDIERGKFRMNTNYCNRWGKCKYMQLCVYGNDERYLEQNFNVTPEVKEVIKNEL